MLESLISAVLRNRFLVLALTGFMAGLGVYTALRLPIDAVPDLTNVQVQVITEAPGLSPLEVESLLSFSVEGALSGLPDVEEIRSVSKFGISVVTVVFEENTDILRARQLVSERLPAAEAAIPIGYGTPILGPISTALGEVYQFQIKGDQYSPMELRTILDWFVAPNLRTVPGVTEINSHGGFLKTYQVTTDPDRLVAYDLTLADVFETIRANNANVGGGYIVREGETSYIRGESQVGALEDIAAIVIEERENVPITVADVATVELAPMIRGGLVTGNGEGEIVTGLVMMYIGGNSREVVGRVKEELDRLARTLPEGVTIEPLYDRSHLIDQTLGTVRDNLFLGGALVMVVLLLLLGNLRGGLIVASAIPLSMLFASNMMLATGVTASLMSLGAIDFGLIVDSSVIMVENCVRRLGSESGTRSKLAIIRDAALEVRKPTLFGEMIIMIVYIPILTLQGTEGKLFRPMAATVIFALLGSMILSVTLMPALASLFFKEGIKEREVWVMRILKSCYKPLLDRSMKSPRIVSLLAIGLIVVSIPIALGLGGEFMPRLNEGDILIEAVRIPSASLDGAVLISTQIEDVVKEFPEVRVVYSKTGRPEIANDVMGVHQTDVWVLLKPQAEWRDGLSRDDLIAEMEEALGQHVPGVGFGFSQPIEMRVNELVAGVKSDVAALLYGPDLDILRQKSIEIERVLATIDGAEDVRAPSTGTLPMLQVQVRREQLARYGIKASAVLDAVSSLGGVDVGTVFEENARFPIRVRISESWRNDPLAIGRIRVSDPKGRPIPINELADIRFEEGPSEVERENVQRRAVISANVRGRDLAGFVAEAEQRVAEQVLLPPGYVVRWGGQFEHLRTASRRLLVVVPLALLLILLLLYTSLGSWRLTVLIAFALPVAATGGVMILALRGLPFSISAGVGFIALFGVAVLNGLVWVNAAEHLRLEGKSLTDASRQASVTRLRPILMTALTDGIGFLPMALATSPGAEIQRPLATVVIGGLITSTALTTLVLPAIYPWFVTALDPTESTRRADPAAVHLS